LRLPSSTAPCPSRPPPSHGRLPSATCGPQSDRAALDCSQARNRAARLVDQNLYSVKPSTAKRTSPCWICFCSRAVQHELPGTAVLKKTAPHSAATRGEVSPSLGPCVRAHGRAPRHRALNESVAHSNAGPRRPEKTRRKNRKAPVEPYLRPQTRHRSRQRSWSLQVARGGSRTVERTRTHALAGPFPAGSTIGRPPSRCRTRYST